MRKKAGRSKSKALAASSTTIAPDKVPAVDQRGLLVALELGADWPSLLEAERSARRVLAQLEGETPAAFAERVASSLETAFARGVELRTVALACNERLDPAADAARRSLVGLALGAMAKHGAGKVYLTSGARSSGRTRHYLSALAQGAQQEWQSAGLEISPDFGRELERASAPRLRARVA